MAQSGRGGRDSAATDAITHKKSAELENAGKRLDVILGSLALSLAGAVSLAVNSAMATVDLIPADDVTSTRMDTPLRIPSGAPFAVCHPWATLTTSSCAVFGTAGAMSLVPVFATARFALRIVRLRCRVSFPVAGASIRCCH